ncbi:MAG: hypothetical protein ABRQ25_15775 [Clostridiaceae bacterium]|jgi:hypothetical protein
MLFQEYCRLACEILYGDTEYQQNKTLITNLFKNTQDVETRLIVIDNLYSTNLSKRFFGFHDLADSINSLGNDDLVKVKISNYLMNCDQDIDRVFSRTYGIDKKGNSKNHAPSILSKYFYFLSSYAFPIHDSYLIKNIDYINNYFHIYVYDESISLFEKLKYIKTASGCSYDDIDSAIWLYGKLFQGSFSLLVNKNRYLQVVRESRIDFDVEISPDDLYKAWLFNNENDKVIEKVLGTSFIRFLQETRLIIH